MRNGATKKKKRRRKKKKRRRRTLRQRALRTNQQSRLIEPKDKSEMANVTLMMGWNLKVWKVTTTTTRRLLPIGKGVDIGTRRLRVVNQCQWKGGREPYLVENESPCASFFSF